MRYKSLIFLLSALFITIGTTATARNASSKQPKQHKDMKVSSEFGLGIGARYNIFSVQPVSADFTPSMTMRTSYGAALQFRLNLGKVFGLQPEISYAYSTLRINDQTNGFSTKVKCNIVQVPVLLSVRIAMFRFNAGPVFRLMDSPNYFLTNSDGGTEQQFLGSLTPIVTYTAGVSVKVGKRTIIDLRYADQFRNIKSTNAYLWTLDREKQNEAQQFRTRCQSIQLRVGLVF